MSISRTKSRKTFGFFPLFLLLGIPIIGQLGNSSAKTSVKGTLANVDGLVRYGKLFLIVATILIMAFLLAWGIKTLKKLPSRRKFRSLTGLLHRIQSDLVLLSEPSVLKKAQLLNLELSKKEAFSELKVLAGDTFFSVKFGSHAHGRMLQSLDLIENDKISLENQTVLVSQWLKVIDLLLK